jgi:uncharacterized protein YggE
MTQKKLLNLLVQPLITVVILFLGILLYSKLVAPISIDLGDNSPKKTFMVEGTGKVTVKPDTFMTDFTIQETGKTQDEAKNKAGDVQKKALDALKKIGISDDQIKTSNVNTYPEYGNTGIVPPNRQPTVTGYTMSIYTQIKAKDGETISKVIDVLSPLGINVSAMQPSAVNTDEAKDKARAAAMADAKKKAESLAKAGGFRLGKIVTIKEGSSDMPGEIRPMLGFTDKSISNSTPIQINPGSEEVSATVSVTYYLNN